MDSIFFFFFFYFGKIWLFLEFDLMRTWNQEPSLCCLYYFMKTANTKSYLVYTQKWKMLIWDFAEQEMIRFSYCTHEQGELPFYSYHLLLQWLSSLRGGCPAYRASEQTPKALQVTGGMDTPCPAVICMEMWTNFSWINTYRSNTRIRLYIC